MANISQVWKLSFQCNDLTSYWELVTIEDSISMTDMGVGEVDGGSPTSMAIIYDTISIEDGATGFETFIEWISLRDSINARVKGLQPTINISDPRFYDYE